MKRFASELHRRRVLRAAGLYIVGAWLVMQVADVLFPAWGLPDAAINVLLLTALLCFPLALVFGWFYDVTTQGIVRAQRAVPGEAPPRLTRFDYLTLSALALVGAIFIANAVRDIASTPPELAGSTDFAVPAIAAPDNSIAVLPFANLGGSDTDDAFCDGVSEEILHRLGDYRDLHIIARTSSFAFKGSDYPIPRIAGILGVKYLLQGSVRRSGDTLRITAQLVDSAGVQRWSQSFDRHLTEIFALQGEIADIVVSTVAPQVALRASADYEPDLDAFQHFLVGRNLLHARQVHEARAELATAIELDPAFAAAQAEYAVALAMWQPDSADRARALRAVERALRLQPGLPRARAAEALLLTETDPVAAESQLREVLAADPTMADAWNWLANVLSTQERYDEEMALRERTLRLDPLHAANTANLAFEYQARGDYAAAERTFLRYAEQPRPALMVLMDAAYFYRTVGRLGEALALYRRAATHADADRSYPHVRALRTAELLLVLGDREAAAERARQPIDSPPTVRIERYARAILDIAPALWRGDYRDAHAQFRNTTAGTRSQPQEPFLHCLELYLAAMAGDGKAPAELDIASMSPLCELVGIDLPTVVAWALQQAGEREAADTLLDEAEQRLASVDRSGRLHASDRLYLYALVAVQRGDHETALDRLGRAVEAGWRDYYLHQHDPRWAPLHSSARYVALVRFVTEDVERQRANL